MFSLKNSQSSGFSRDNQVLWWTLNSSAEPFSKNASLANFPIIIPQLSWWGECKMTKFLHSTFYITIQDGVVDCSSTVGTGPVDRVVIWSCVCDSSWPAVEMLLDVFSLDLFFTRSQGLLQSRRDLQQRAIAKPANEHRTFRWGHRLTLLVSPATTAILSLQFSVILFHI